MAIILIGPPGAGKSTVGALLAGGLGRDFVDADAASAPFYAEVGWSVERLAQIVSERGYEHAHREWEVALTHAVEQLVHHHPDAVIALGAGHTHQTRPDLFARVEHAFADAERVILLRPAADPVTAVQVLRQRCLDSKGRDWIRDGVDWLERWCGDGRDEALATEVVHNAGETAAETARRLQETSWTGHPSMPFCGENVD